MHVCFHPLANVTIGFTQEEYHVFENAGVAHVFIERNDVILDRNISFTIFTIMGPGEAVGMFSEILCYCSIIPIGTFTSMLLLKICGSFDTVVDVHVQ